MSEQSVTMALNEVQTLARDCLSANGWHDSNALALATTVMITERDGLDSHGLFRLPGYGASSRSARANGAAESVIGDRAPAVFRADGNGGFAPPALEACRGPLTDCAGSQDISALVLTDIHHFAALGI